MLKNILTKLLTHSNPHSNKPKKMLKGVKNDFDLHLYVENLLKKSQMLGESIMRNFQLRFPTWYMIQMEQMDEMKVSNLVSTIYKFPQLLPSISLMILVWQYFHEVNTQRELRRTKSYRNSEFLTFHHHQISL